MKKLYILALKFDYFVISQDKDLHLKEINIVQKWPRHSGSLKGNFTIKRIFMLLRL